MKYILRSSAKMTVSYSLNVSKATFAGFLKLLFRWSGSIYKGMWRESLIFCVLFLSLQIVLRHGLTVDERSTAWQVIQFVNSVGEDVPYSFVLGFYVSFVASRWMTQFGTVPWPDRLCHSIAAYVHGIDDRSRMIRRSMGRYAYLLQVLTYQTVSTSVKKRFPTVQHLVEAGMMTPEEMAVYEKTNFSYGKWWLPAHWFTSLAVRAHKEGRIKDSVMLKALLEELMSYRTMCAMTIAYDWISVPLAYTQVATITAYFKAFTLLIGKQTLDGPSGFTVDFYFPFATIYKFLWTIGWLKVAQQILNPYGEDDDDFELNWTLDRSVQLVYDVVDRYHLMHPKLKKDAFWDVQEIRLPQTEHSARYMMNPDLGTAFKLEIDEVKYMPMDELCEKDNDEIEYKNRSMKKKGATRQNSSFIRRVFNSGFVQSVRRKSRTAKASKSWPEQEGISNPAFSMSEDAVSEPNIPKKSSLRNLVKKLSPDTKAGSIKSSQMNNATQRQNSYASDDSMDNEILYVQTASKKCNNDTQNWPLRNTEDIPENDGFQDNFELETTDDILMPSIPEEASRANSFANIDFILKDGGHSEQAFAIFSKSAEMGSIEEKWKSGEGKEYESSCSNPNESCKSSAGNEALEHKRETNEVVVTIEDKTDRKNII